MSSILVVNMDLIYWSVCSSSMRGVYRVIGVYLDLGQSSFGQSSLQNPRNSKPPMYYKLMIFFLNKCSEANIG